MSDEMPFTLRKPLGTKGFAGKCCYYLNLARNQLAFDAELMCAALGLFACDWDCFVDPVCEQ